MLKSNNTALVIISCVFIMLHLCGCVHQPVTKLPSPDLSKHRYDKLVAVAGLDLKTEARILLINYGTPLLSY